MSLKVENTITIDAPIGRVWDALVNPEKTMQYMFGCKALSDWKVGDAVIWKMMHEGKEIIPVSGYVLAIDPMHLLSYSVIDPNSGMEIVPENHLRVTYQLAEQNNQTTLIVTQDGFEDAADGQKRYQDVYNNGDGWNPILVMIKKLVEEGH
ncbi:MAG: SRPBCC domain-containing protein [Cyclobacteriaceae bacterium]|nr:SRPBCC domain-containing protein [Cyclobacteriaceae bacterium]